MSEVVILISNITTTIRMSSNYCPESIFNNETPQAILCLSDSILYLNATRNIGY